MLEVKDINVYYGAIHALKGVSLTVADGELVSLIGANGAGKTTFLRILSGDLEPTTGEVVISKDQRMSVLKQDHFQYDQYTVLDTVIMGNAHLYEVMKEKDAIYEKPDFTDEDGIKAAELEAKLAAMDPEKAAKVRAALAAKAARDKQKKEA